MGMGNFYTDFLAPHPLFRSPKRVHDSGLLEPNVRRKVEAILAEAAGHGLKLMIYETYRSQERQAVLFRREVDLASAPKSAKGWIVADSRYRLTVNGERVQWGPAPSDPRHLEVDPIDLTPFLKAGRNVIGVEVLFYGYGDGTWPFGK